MKALATLALPLLVASACNPAPTLHPIGPNPAAGVDLTPGIDPNFVAPPAYVPVTALDVKYGWPPEPVVKLEAASLQPVNDHLWSEYVQHERAHIDLFDNGEKVTVPPNLGIVTGWGTAAVHTHQPDGVLYIVSDVVRQFTLGQFFTLWGVDLSKANAVYSNGTKVDDPSSLILTDKQEIAVVYGTAPASIPDHYSWW